MTKQKFLGQYVAQYYSICVDSFQIKIMNINDNIITLVDKIKELGLSEDKWKTSDWLPKEPDLWECLVGLFLHKHGYQPKRFSSKSTNLDFGFTQKGQEYYGECVCPEDGVSKTISDRSNDEDYTKTSDGLSFVLVGTSVVVTQNNMGLRITNSIYSKSKDQITEFHKQNGVKPTIVFVNSGLLTDMPQIGKIDSKVSPLGTCAPSLYGLSGASTIVVPDGTVRMEEQCDLHKGVDVPISRMGFRKGDFNNISAVFHTNVRPSQLANQLYDEFDGCIISLFRDNAELIYNASAGDIALEDTSLFPSVLQVFIDMKGVIQQQQTQRLIPIYKRTI